MAEGVILKNFHIFIALIVEADPEYISGLVSVILLTNILTMLAMLSFLLSVLHTSDNRCETRLKKLICEDSSKSLTL